MVGLVVALVRPRGGPVVLLGPRPEGALRALWALVARMRALRALSGALEPRPLLPIGGSGVSEILPVVSVGCGVAAAPVGIVVVVVSFLFIPIITNYKKDR